MQHQQNLLMPGMRHGALSPHPQFPEYGGGMPSLLPGTPLFPGNLRVPRNIHPQPFQQQPHLPRSRRTAAQLDPAGIRSPLLEEFRSNKSRKWELKVRCIAQVYSYVALVTKGNEFERTSLVM
jgi:hypothetical protein